MNLLLDTHIALWALSDDPRLSKRAQALLLDAGNKVSVSTISLWEIAIKHALGRGGQNAVTIGAGAALNLIEAAGFAILPVSASHAVAVDDLPRLHADPFDRLLVAQAIAEPLRLVTSDAILARYSDTVMLV